MKPTVWAYCEKDLGARFKRIVNDLETTVTAKVKLDNDALLRIYGIKTDEDLVDHYSRILQSTL